MKRYNERKTMKISAPAKINLFLEILGKRLDGYHEIVTVMQKVSLFDYIYMEELEGGIECDCSDPALAMNEGNLVMKAIRLMQQESNTQKGVGFSFSIANNNDIAVNAFSPPERRLMF